MNFDFIQYLQFFYSDLDNNNIRTISTILTATPFFRDSFEIDGHFNTDTPLQQRSIKAKAAFLYRINQVINFIYKIKILINLKIHIFLCVKQIFIFCMIYYSNGLTFFCVKI